MISRPVSDNHAWYHELNLFLKRIIPNGGEKLNVELKTLVSHTWYEVPFALSVQDP